MKLTAEEQAMLAGEQGPVRQWAIQHQMAVGAFFDAEDFVPVSQAHIMADTESLGGSGVAWLEALVAQPGARLAVPTITDPRGLDLATYKKLRQTEVMAELEVRAAKAFEALGVLMTNTCINYQTVLPAVLGEHLAMGDTGVTIYVNSVMGAHSNFEGGPSALAAGLTGRTPRYGYHLPRHRRGTRPFELKLRPRDLADWRGNLRRANIVEVGHRPKAKRGIVLADVSVVTNVRPPADHTNDACKSPCIQGWLWAFF